MPNPKELSVDLKIVMARVEHAKEQLEKALKALNEIAAKIQ